jgi:hypothetical protein
MDADTSPYLCSFVLLLSPLLTVLSLSELSFWHGCCAQADGQLIDMMSAFKAVLIYFGKREAEAETDKEKCEEVLSDAHNRHPLPRTNADIDLRVSDNLSHPIHTNMHSRMAYRCYCSCRIS